MKLNVVIFKNVLTNAFTTPQFIDITPEDAATQLKRSIILDVEKDTGKSKVYEDLVMCDLARFDDETGELTPVHKIELLNCRELIITLKSKKLKDAEIKASMAKDDEIKVGA